MCNLAFVRLVTSVLLFVPLLPIWGNICVAQTTIIAGTGATVVVLSAPAVANTSNCGLIVAPPGSVVVVQRVLASTSAAKPEAGKTTPSTKSGDTLIPVQLLMRPDYDSVKGAKNGEKEADWKVGSLKGLPDPIEVSPDGLQIPRGALIRITFDDFKDAGKPDDLGKNATITYANAEGKLSTARGDLSALKLRFVATGRVASRPVNWKAVKAINFKP
jgi:hypothetical protein